MKNLRVAALASAVGLMAWACADGGATGTTAGEAPTIVVSTSILGDVVSSLVGDEARVVTVMPVGASPHDFQPSARDVATVREADALVVNGAGFEENLLEVIGSAADDGVPVHEAISAVDALPVGSGGPHADEPAEAHADDRGTGDDRDTDGHGAVDPHFFTDPARMADAAEGIVSFLTAAVPALDSQRLRIRAAEYVAELRSLDTEVEELLAAVPADRRVLVTNHEVFGYFADRYGFEVVGVVVPGGGTSESTSAAALDDLARLVRAEDVPAVFVDTSSPGRLAATLAREVGDVELVELFSESLGEPGSGAASYVEMVRTNAERVAAALG